MTTGRFTGLLLHTATVLRRQEAASGGDKKDRFGQPTRDELPHHTLLCRCSRPTGGERMQERSRDVVEANYKLFLDVGADLRERDVVTVTDPRGTIICERAEVNFVAVVYDGDDEHHREAKIVTQRPAS